MLVSGPKNGNANALVPRATDHRVRLVSFLGESQPANHSISFTAKEAISRHYEGREVALLSKTRSKIFLLLDFLMGGQHLKRVLE